MPINIQGTDRWKDSEIMKATFTCGYCGSLVTSSRGMYIGSLTRYNEVKNDRPQGIFICTNCKLPTFIYGRTQVPGNRFGSVVKNTPDIVNDVYEEARSAFSVGAYTAVVLLCRKLLMHVAVDFGADENKNFVHYVNFLQDNHYVTANSDKWVDAIRKFGNESTHEILVNTKEDGEKIIKFSEMILRSNYEYPAMIDEQD